MDRHQQVDAPGRTQAYRVILPLILILVLGTPAWGQEFPGDAARLSAAQKAFDDGHWEEAARIARGPAHQSPDLDLLAGLALARLERWKEALQALEVGHRKAPSDARFLVELAGIAYRLRDAAGAKRDLLAALRLNPRDAYAREFLGTLYFLDGNVEAALKYWNAIEKPRLRAVNILPKPRLEQEFLDRAVAFSAPQVLTPDALLTTQARLENLTVFSSQRIELVPVSSPADSKECDATLYLNERNGWGNSTLQGLFHLLSGLPFSSVYPDFYNLGHAAIDFTSLGRWDAEKRRVHAALSAPLFHDPSQRLRIYLDARDERWNLTQTFFGAGASLGDLQLLRVAGGAEFRMVENGRWSWSTGIEFAHRSFQDLAGHTTPAEKPFFTNSSSFSYWLAIDRSLVRLPEHRFTLDSSNEAILGRNFARGLGPFASVRASLRARWFPKGKGDDYEMQAQLRAGGTLGRVPLDELFQLGVERDNDLWLRGHAGTTGGRKGAAPLGRRYLLANWEMDKQIYGNGLFNMKLGPFIDSGAVADSSRLFGSQRWLVDAGIQCKMRFFGNLTVIVSYGRNLRGAKDVFFASVRR